jgi:hypothetical protein
MPFGEKRIQSKGTEMRSGNSEQFAIVHQREPIVDLSLQLPSCEEHWPVAGDDPRLLTAYEFPSCDPNESLSGSPSWTGGQAHFAPKPPQNEPVPDDGFRIGSEFDEADEPLSPPVTPPLTTRLFMPPHLFGSPVSPMEPYEAATVADEPQTAAFHWSVVLTALAVYITGIWAIHALCGATHRAQRQTALLVESRATDTSQQYHELFERIDEPRMVAGAVAPQTLVTQAYFQFKGVANERDETGPSHVLGDVQLASLERPSPITTPSVDADDHPAVLDDFQKLVSLESVDDDSLPLEVTDTGALVASPADCESGLCGMPLPTFNTAIHWAENVDTAASLAERAEKLVFLIHVSGNFAIEEFT